MGRPFDIGYFKKQKTKDRASVAKKRIRQSFLIKPAFFL